MLSPGMIQVTMLGFVQYSIQKRDRFEYFPRNEHLLDSEKTEEYQKLKRFSQQFYTEKWNDTLCLMICALGKLWDGGTPKGNLFSLFLKDSADNKLVVQRGRLEG
jgi:hypothetical protein